ncbi:MAG: 16S rRNA (uracil(1498)-N(3))-methyltransferase [Clostridiales bacterium]|nr:16S rRNA (uracil(1498)-N(3))-methyltransferase [Clostridiales bacterium]
MPCGRCAGGDRMPKFFVDHVDGETVELTGENARHISRALRMKPGEVVMVSDGRGTDYGCRIQSFTEDTVTLQVLYRQASGSEPSVAVTLYQSLPKGDKMDDIIQKCVELGVTRIVPVRSARCISRPDGKAWEKKRQRYNKIALEAAKQCGRGIIPEVAALTSLRQAAEDCAAQCKLLCYEGGGRPLRQALADMPETVAVFIGPEGGFEPEEAAYLSASGAVQVTLGNRILRTQTAPVAALSCIMLLSGNLE